MLITVDDDNDRCKFILSNKDCCCQAQRKTMSIITTLPLEIIDMILDLVEHNGDDRDSGRLSWQTRRALRACSLISPLWLSESRKHLFRTIPIPNDIASLHAFKRICASPDITFGPSHVKVLDVTGRSPFQWGWHWWRTHTRGSRADEDGKRKKVELSTVEMKQIFGRFFDWTSNDAAAARIFRTLGELRFLDVAFEDIPENIPEDAPEPEWVILSPRTYQVLHQSFPSLSKLVLKRVRFSNESVFTGLLGTLSRTLETLDMDCVAIDDFEHRDNIIEPAGGRPSQPLLPTLHTLRLTGVSINLAIFLIPSPTLQNVTFDIADDDIRREIPLPILVDLLASVQALKSLSLRNRCSGSYRDADIGDNGNSLSRMLARAPSIEHLTLDIRSNSRPYIVNLLSQEPNTTLHTLHIPELQSLLVDYSQLDDTLKRVFPQLRALRFNCRVHLSPCRRRNSLAPVPGSSASAATGLGPGPGPMVLPPIGQLHIPAHAHAHVPTVLTNMFGVNNSDTDDSDWEELDSDNEEFEAMFAELRYRLEASKRGEDPVKTEEKLAELIGKIEKEEEVSAKKLKEERSREVLRRFGKKLPWCEERGCLKPVFQFDG
ncbi:hypothetical protein V5O48_016905 [Marasmius crinis-equi]|uniref:F-box domain-containing protein n=1 Tax=Marasmius crinis-equi TaxID=585013 RepID=A0ABR3EQM4_9AGAR